VPPPPRKIRPNLPLPEWNAAGKQAEELTAIKGADHHQANRTADTQQGAHEAGASLRPVFRFIDYAIGL
jgi:hypothetical protein